MSSLIWRHLADTAIWSANSVDNAAWAVRCKEDGLFYLIDNNRLPYNAAPFCMLQSAQAWCEEREDELIEAQPARRLVKLYRSRTTGDVELWDADRFVNENGWKCIGSVWITEGEFADD